MALHSDNKQDSVFQWSGAAAVHHYALWPLQCFSNRCVVRIHLAGSHRSCLIYLDNVVIVGWTFQEQHGSLQMVFQAFQGGCLELNPQYCQLFQKEVWYIRHIASLEWMTQRSGGLYGGGCLQRTNISHRASLVCLLQEVHCWICWHETNDSSDRRKAAFPVILRSRSHFLVPERIALYGTHPKISVVTWQVPCQHRQEQHWNWRCTVTNIGWPGENSGLIQQDLIQGWEEILCEPTGITGYCEETGTLTKIHLQARVLPAQWPLCLDLATEF